MVEKSFRFWPQDLPRSLTYPQTGFDAHLAVAAARDPDRCLIDFCGWRIGYGEADRIVTDIAGFLQDECGLARGDRVIFYMQNCPQFILAFQAALRAGGAVTPVNPMSVSDELAYIVADSGAQIAFVGEEMFDRAPDVLATLRRVVAVRAGDCAPQDAEASLPDPLRAPARADLPDNAVRWRDMLSSARAFEPVPLGPDDMSALVYSSGTTGKPKGCVHTHRSMAATALSTALWEGLGPGDCVLAVSPLFHVTGVQFGMNRALVAGATVALLQRWDVRVAAATVERCGITHWNGVPLLVAELLSDPEAAARDLSSIRMFSGGGAAMPAAVAQQARERFGRDFVEGYGLTEAMGPSHFNPPDRAKKQCLGIPSFDVESVVVDPQTLRILPAGEVGEILLRGPGLFREYWNRPDATREAFVEVEGARWFRTGDLGRTDEDGYFFFADRLKRMINAAGYKIWPAEIESLMFAHPSVRECCVIAAPDARRGEMTKAVVALRADAAPSEALAEEIIAWCRTKMAAYKVPREVAFVDALPRGGTGKIDWRRLQEAEFADAARRHGS
jgi:fatty-acyl-CoA synthase